MLPDLILPEQEQHSIGIWGQRHTTLKAVPQSSVYELVNKRKVEQLPFRH